MIDLSRFAEVLTLYKQDFVAVTWGNEKYKWEAVKHFQDNWDINADDFAEMLERALAKTYNLLASMNSYPKGMIVNSAKAAPEDVRAMFMALFDESRDYWERINEFKQRSNDLLEQTGQKGQSYQTENAIHRLPPGPLLHLRTARCLGTGARQRLRYQTGAVRTTFATTWRYTTRSTPSFARTRSFGLSSARLTPDCYPTRRCARSIVRFYISRYSARPR